MNREKVINWLRENTTREQWNNRDTLFFVGVNEPFTFDWETVPYDCAKGVCVIGYGKNKDAEPIHYSDVFKQPVFIDGAEYLIYPLKNLSYPFNGVHFTYNLNTNRFNGPDGVWLSADSFGTTFTVELVHVDSTSPVKPQSPLYDRVVKALGNRGVPIGGEDHLVGQVKVDHSKAVLLDKVIKEFNIPFGGDVIQWLHNRTNTQKKPEPVFFELANYPGFSGEFNEKEVFTEAFKTIRITQEPDEFYNELRVIYGNPEATDNEILDDYRKCKNIVNAMTQKTPLILGNQSSHSHADTSMFDELAEQLHLPLPVGDPKHVLTKALSQLKEQAVIVGRVGKLNEVCQEYGVGYWGDSVIDSVIDYIKIKSCEVNLEPTVDRSKPRNKYDREIIPGVHVDVYDVLGAFTTNSAAVDHAVKKLLAPGQRGVKDRITDLNEAINSIQREIDRIGEWSVSEDSE